VGARQRGRRDAAQWGLHLSTVGDDLDKIQDKLHDDGALWTRTELRRWYVDAYRDLLAFSGAVRRWRPLDVPGRHTYAITHEWEARHASGGTVRKTSRAGLGERYQSTALWEVELTAGVTPTASLYGITHEWERSVLSGGVDLQYRFTFPRNHQRIVRLEWEGRRLHPVSVRELDDADTDWASQAGEPRFWTTGTGRVRAVELYEITTTYIRGYHLIDPETGLPRSFSGDRSYSVTTSTPAGNTWAYATPGDADGVKGSAPFPGLGWRFATYSETYDGYATDGADRNTFAWEAEYGFTELTFGVGTIRGLTSDDRQYWPVAADAQPDVFCGRIADWRSSNDSLLALEVVTPDLDVQEDDTPALIPAPMQKYLRFFVLSRAFGRPGEGRNPILADHYDRRFQRGVKLLQRFGDVARKDRQFQREQGSGSVTRPARVRLPAEFPSVWR
jgi:hypothetical protein